jgi:drug/metabolite transporter (DMT)-like permease
MDWFPLALLSAVAIATADALTKRYFSQVDPWDAASARFVWSGVLLLPWALSAGMPPLDPRFWAWVLVLIPLDLLAVFIYVRAITTSPLSHTLPYLSFSPVFSLGVGYALLDETVTIAGGLGVVLITAGAYLLNGAELSRGGWLAPFRFMLREPGPRLMLGVALIFSVTAVLGKGAVQYMPGADFGAFYAVLFGLCATVVVLVRGRSPLRIACMRPVAVLGVATAMAIMIVSHFVAIEQVTAGYMIAVKRTSMLFGLIYGALWFRELELGRNLAAAVLMLVGVALILVP